MFSQHAQPKVTNPPAPFSPAPAHNAHSSHGAPVAAPGAHASAPAHAPAAAPVSTSQSQSNVPVSVIGRDLKILGGGLRLISEGNLTVDGVVEGDVLATNVTIGEHGHVTGLVHGETVTIQGHVSGTVRAVTVTLHNGADVNADLHHNSLSLEFGAAFEGRTRRYGDRAELVPDFSDSQNNPAASTGAPSVTAAE